MNNLSTIPADYLSVKIKKYVGNSDVSALGAFAFSTKLCFEISLSGSLCEKFTPHVSMVIFPAETDTNDAPGVKSGASPFSVIAMPYGKNRLSGEYDFGATLNLPMVCSMYGLECGLFRYCIEAKLGEDCFYTSSINNVDFFVVKNVPPIPFRLLCHKDDFCAPSGFGGGVMYQIFPDRFCDGGVKFPVRKDAEFNSDWYDGIPQYGEYPGAFVKNNMFFGGNLCGITAKLPYLSQMGVTCIYLNPIFKAYSNHKYDTGDYMSVDEMFGGDEALCELIDKAHALGMKIVLDGVFNHTGDDSIYFDKYGKYGGGAYSCAASPRRKWYNFKEYPEKYESWWGIEILPKLNQKEQSCREYFTGKNGVCEKYAALGIDGWRLDVADELPDVFLDEFRCAVKKQNPDAIIIGEVWENAADKVAYGQLRRYFQGDQLDSVMNYPFKNAVLDFLMREDSSVLYNTLVDIYSSYPKAVCDNLMNLLGTHDTDRILTALSGEDISSLSNSELAVHKMSADARKIAVKKLKIASALQYTVYGFPSVYYGDEAGCEGGHDPFCRRPFPWGREDTQLLEHYKKLGEIRRSHGCFDGGAFAIEAVSESAICCKRSDKTGGSVVYTAANASEKEQILEISLPSDSFPADLLTGEKLCFFTSDGKTFLKLDGLRAAVFALSASCTKEDEQ